MSSAELFADSHVAGQRLRRFAVAWRNTTLKQIHAVGMLTFDGHAYRFRYLPTAPEVPGFRPFIGFPKLGNDAYVSTRLWPFFALRAMDSRRPDFDQYVERLGLTRDASTLDILSRSGGEMQGDVTVNLIEEPTVTLDGATEYFFLIRGSRHATAIYDTAAIVTDLRPGTPLILMPDAANPVNDDALLVATEDGRPIGWVPDLLTPYFEALNSVQSKLTVARNNGPESAWHLRLLVHAEGTIDPSLSLFNDPEWNSVATHS